MELAPMSIWTRIRENMIAVVVALVALALVPVLSFLAFALQPVVVVAVVTGLVASYALCVSSLRFRRWVDAELERELTHRGLRLARDVAVHPGHAWARLSRDVAIVGADDVAQAALGPVDAVDLPPIGRRVLRGETLFRLRRGPRSIDVASPVSGTVLASNGALTQRPHLVNRRPFDQGWAVRLATNNGTDELALLRGRPAQAWFRGEVDRLLREVADGADTPADALHRCIDDDAWSRLVRSTFAACGSTG